MSKLVRKTAEMSPKWTEFAWFSCQKRGHGPFALFWISLWLILTQLVHDSETICVVDHTCIATVHICKQKLPWLKSSSWIYRDYSCITIISGKPEEWKMRTCIPKILSSPVAQFINLYIPVFAYTSLGDEFRYPKSQSYFISWSCGQILNCVFREDIIVSWR